MLYYNEAPFHGTNKRYIADDMLHIAQKWFQESSRGTARLFGGEDNAAGMLETLQTMMDSGISAERRGDCEELRRRIIQVQG